MKKSYIEDLKKELKDLLIRLEFNSILKELDLAESQDQINNEITMQNTENKGEKRNYSSKGKYSIFSSQNYKELFKIIDEHEIISIDFETTSLDPYEADLVGIAICIKPFEAYFF